MRNLHQKKEKEATKGKTHRRIICESSIDNQTIFLPKKETLPDKMA